MILIDTAASIVNSLLFTWVTRFVVPAQWLNLPATLLAYDRTAVPDVRDINMGLGQNAYYRARATFVSHDPSSVLLHESVFSVVTALSDGYLHAVREVL